MLLLMNLLAHSLLTGLAICFVIRNDSSAARYLLSPAAYI